MYILSSWRLNISVVISLSFIHWIHFAPQVLTTSGKSSVQESCPLCVLVEWWIEFKINLNIDYGCLKKNYLPKITWIGSLTRTLAFTFLPSRFPSGYLFILFYLGFHIWLPVSAEVPFPIFFLYWFSLILTKLHIFIGADISSVILWHIYYGDANQTLTPWKVLTWYIFFLLHFTWKK